MDLSKYRCDGDFILSSGRRSTALYNMRDALSFPIDVKKIIARIDVPPHIDHICGVPSGGVPWATALSLMHNIPLILLHKSRKGHGTGVQIEGMWHEGEDVFLIDDVCTTGGSLTRARDVLEEHGLNVTNMFVLVNRSPDPLTDLKWLYMDTLS